MELENWVLQKIFDYIQAGNQPVSFTQHPTNIITYLTQLKKPRKHRTIKKQKLQTTVHKVLKDLQQPRPNPPSKQTKSSFKKQVTVPKAPIKLPQQKPKTPLSLSQIACPEPIRQSIQTLIIRPMKNPQFYQKLQIQPIHGILLCGPPGTGKTYLASAISNQLQLPFFKVTATELVSSMSGGSQRKIRQTFKEALQSAPSLLFLDEIDAITPNRTHAHKEMERRIVSSLMSCLDQIQGFLQHGRFVLVLAATNRPEAIDQALRRNGRFDREIHFGIPSESERLAILNHLVAPIAKKQDIDLKFLAKKTPGFVAADLKSLVKQAGNLAIQKHLTGNSLLVQNQDFLKALKIVQPSSRREGFTTIPETTWQDIGGLKILREALYWSIVDPIQNPDTYSAMGVQNSAGILLCGPPGCGKTLLAKAVANQSQANFISINGPEILNKYVGESQKAVRSLFTRARDSAPCVIFFDEIDSLCARRGSDNQATQRVVNQLLTELDGLESRKQVFVIAATNRPDILDHAILRAGRFDKLYFVSLPDFSDRISILQTLLMKRPKGSLNLALLASRTEGFSGADLKSLVNQAASYVIRERGGTILQKHLEEALENVKPSVTPQQILHYESMKSLITNMIN